MKIKVEQIEDAQTLTRNGNHWFTKEELRDIERS